MVSGLTKLFEAIQALFILISKDKNLVNIFQLLIVLFFLWLVFIIGYKVFSVIMKRKDRFMCRSCFTDSQKRFSDLAEVLKKNTSAIEQINRQRGL